MYKFSRVFFVLFVLLTVLPVFLLIIWNIFSFQEIERNHIDFKLSNKINEIEHNYKSFLNDERKYLQKLVDSTKGDNIKLEKYKEILGINRIWWIDSNYNNELTINSKTPFKLPSKYLDQEIAYYDLIYNSEKQDEELVGIFVIPANISKHKGLVVVQTVDFDKISHLKPPEIIRIYTGEKYNPANLLYYKFNHKFFNNKQGEHRPPHPNEKIGSKPQGHMLGYNSPLDDQPGHHPPRDMIRDNPPPPNDNFGPKPPEHMFGENPPLFDDQFDPKLPKNILGPKGPKIPALDQELYGKEYKLKNYEGKTIATIKVGIPEFNEPFWIFPNPMLTGVFEKFYLIGALIPVLGLILSIFAGMYLKKYILNPIEDLSNISKTVIHGDLTKRVNENVKQPEIKDTLKNFNKMLSSMQEKEELQRSFIANLTHDFRTPLLAENRTIELLLDEFKDASKPEQIDLLESLLRNNEHLLEMVNLLLENYKFESGKLKLNLKCTHIENILNQCFKQLKTLAEDKNIELNSEFEPGIPEIIIDKNLIKRSFINLIINALENIPKNSKIIVSGKIDGHNLQIKFWDNGPGISKDDAEKLFERYYTGNHTERKIGSGLGLYICRKFIEAHGGYITVNSEKGEYSEFIVTLPITRENLV